MLNVPLHTSPIYSIRMLCVCAPFPDRIELSRTEQSSARIEENTSAYIIYIIFIGSLALRSELMAIPTDLSLIPSWVSHEPRTNTICASSSFRSSSYLYLSCKFMHFFIGENCLQHAACQCKLTLFHFFASTWKSKPTKKKKND